MTDLPRVITVREFVEALVEAGVLTKEQVNRSTRFVIDADPQNVAVILYVQFIGDERLLSVVQSLAGIEVKVVASHLCDNPNPHHNVPNDCITLPLSEEEVTRRWQERS